MCNPNGRGEPQPEGRQPKCIIQESIYIEKHLLLRPSTKAVKLSSADLIPLSYLVLWVESCDILWPDAKAKKDGAGQTGQSSDADLTSAFKIDTQGA